MKKIFYVSFLVLAGTLFLMSFSLHLEQRIRLNQGRWVAPETAKKLKNPYSGKASIKAGKAIYNTQCVVCHGQTGNGDTPAGKALNPPAADHTSSAVQNQTDGEIFWKISEGRGPMISWKNILSEEDRWNVVNYIRTLKK